jgi:hypothetical protein
VWGLFDVVMLVVSLLAAVCLLAVLIFHRKMRT